MLLPLTLLIVILTGFGLQVGRTTAADGTQTSGDRLTAGTQKSKNGSSIIEIKIGFLVGSQRLEHNHTYSRPGRWLLHAFNYGIHKINQLHSTTTGPTSTNIRFVPIVAEAYGNEGESIRQTVALITKHRVNFIVGPQETCQLEPRLGSVFNVAMISHYCPAQWTPSAVLRAQQQQQPAPLLMTFIQTKPPHWKIADRVVTLVEQLFGAYNWYPQRLVLLYFREPEVVAAVAAATATANNNNHNNSSNRKKSAGDKGAMPLLSTPPPLSQTLAGTFHWPPRLGQGGSAAEADDAIQYKLIGELLEIKLNDLLVGKTSNKGSSVAATTTTNTMGSSSGDGRKLVRTPLTVLNWHTTFHYGYTKNPFRQIIRRHLFQQTAFANQSQCSGESSGRPMARSSTVTTSATKASLLSPVSVTDEKAAIYIVVGHYYEHLGLMLALNELSLLGQQQQQQQPQPTAANEQHRSSVPLNQRQRRPSSVVIGVDIEQYDERDDSVRFLRGLLMDESGRDRQHRSASSATSDLESIAHMYRHYLGVVPARPIREPGEFLDEMRTVLCSQSGGGGGSPSQRQQLVNSSEDRSHSAAAAAVVAMATTTAATTTVPNQTLNDLVQLCTRPQLIRWPVEAYYLNDSLQLLGSYFSDCVQRQSQTLDECSDGRRAFEWFRNRKYSSVVSDQLTKFDSFAQADGLYTLITRRLETDDDDEFGLVPVGQFVNNIDASPENPEAHRLEFHASSSTIDPVWLPLWCHVQQHGPASELATSQAANISGCDRLLATLQSTSSRGDVDDSDDSSPYSPSSEPQYSSLHVLLAILLLIVASVSAAGCLVVLITGRANFQRSFGLQKSVNTGWFNEEDEDNFLKIVHRFLFTPETLLGTTGQQQQADDDDEPAGRNSNVRTAADSRDSQRAMVELHCHMFPFPSCKFVHWLTALHQLKEMMFQWQTNCESRVAKCSDRRRLRLGRLAEAARNLSRLEPAPSPLPEQTSRGFFTNRHKATNSMRLLLNKYKSINQCLCRLGELKHCAVVALHGVTLSYAMGTEHNKMARLIVEQPDRGNMRDALRLLDDTLDCDEANQFRGTVVIGLISDLLDGLSYLHESKVEFHGELRAQNCLLTWDWRLKLAGFHAHHLRRSLGEYEQKLMDRCVDATTTTTTMTTTAAGGHMDELIYSAPEVLQNHNRRASLNGSELKLADFYSFAFVVYELLVGQEPWSCATQVANSRLLVERVKVDSGFRPPLSRLDKNPTCSSLLDLDAIQRLIRSCWSQLADRRPQSALVLRNRLESSYLTSYCLPSSSSSSTTKLQRPGPSASITKDDADPTLRISNNNGQPQPQFHVMKCYAELVERSSSERRKSLEIERRKCMSLKLKLLPESIVLQLDNNQPVATRQFECVSFCLFRLILLPDAAEPSPSLLERLNDFLGQLESLVNSYHKHVHLVDSQVDSSLRYMVYAGEPLELPQMACSNGSKSAPSRMHSQLVASFALQLIDLVNRWEPKSNKFTVQVKCGLHCGPVVGGLLSSPRDNNTTSDAAETNDDDGGSKQARYVMMGSAMQIVDTLESTSLPQRIQISAEFRQQLIESLQAPQELEEFGSRRGYVMIRREGRIHAKNFGEFEAYWLLNGPRLTTSQSLLLATRRHTAE